MATAASTIRISGLARRLINDGYLSEQDASNAQQEAHENNVPLASYLVTKMNLLLPMTLLTRPRMNLAFLYLISIR